MAIKRVQILLVVLSIVISAGIGVLAYNVASQVDDGITENAGYYSVIIGPAGSQTQLAINTMYFTAWGAGAVFQKRRDAVGSKPISQ
jgi:NO-binding membrane sensor protein with MHYT domain